MKLRLSVTAPNGMTKNLRIMKQNCLKGSPILEESVSAAHVT